MTQDIQILQATHASVVYSYTRDVRESDARFSSYCIVT